MSTWSAVITRYISQSIEVEVEASSFGEAKKLIKANLDNGKYDQRLIDSHYVECDQDEIYDLKEESNG